MTSPEPVVALTSAPPSAAPEPANADPVARDPDDASAPVLADLARPTTGPNWSTWDMYRPRANGQSATPPAPEPSEPAAELPSIETPEPFALAREPEPAAEPWLEVPVDPSEETGQPPELTGPAASTQLPVPPLSFAERTFGPTPPEGLFSTSPTPAGAAQADVAAEYPDAVEPQQVDEWSPAAEWPSASEQPTTAQWPTAPDFSLSAEQQPAEAQPDPVELPLSAEQQPAEAQPDPVDATVRRAAAGRGAARPGRVATVR